MPIFPAAAVLKVVLLPSAVARSHSPVEPNQCASSAIAGSLRRSDFPSVSEKKFHEAPQRLTVSPDVYVGIASLNSKTSSGNNMLAADIESSPGHHSPFSQGTETSPKT